MKGLSPDVEWFDGGWFYRGKTECADCDKPISFFLRVEVAFFQPVMLCRACMWASEPDVPKYATMLEYLREDNL